MSSDSASKNGKKTRGHPFAPGNPGGPGRPSGSRNKASIALDVLAEGAAPAAMAKLAEAVAAGDMRAIEILLSRVWPIRKGRPVTLTMPVIKTASDLAEAMGCVTEAMASGDLTPEEAQAVSAVLETKRRAIETVELEARLSALEQVKR